MAAGIKRKAHISGLVFTAMLWCSLVACTGPLVYRPEKHAVQDDATPEEQDEGLPPMPDPKVNDATPAGVDTTGIGIRDDVHIWIYENYTTTVKRTIMMTMAKGMQDIMASPPATVAEAKNQDQSYKDAAMMLRAVRGLTQGQAAEMDRLLYRQTVNTPERLKAYLQYNLLLAGGKDTH